MALIHGNVDLLTNALLFAADLAALAFAWRLRRGIAVFRGVLGVVLACALLGRFLGEDSFGSMRLFCYGLFLHGTLLALAYGALFCRHNRPLALLGFGVALVLPAIAFQAFVVEPGDLEITRRYIYSPKLKRPLTVAVVADLQTDQVGAYEEMVFARLMGEAPDLVLFVGDYVQEDDDRRRARLITRLNEALKKVLANVPLGALAVEGNVGYDDDPRLFDGLPVRYAVQSTDFETGGIRIRALALNDSGNTRLRVAESSLFQIVFGHRPDFALGDVKADLLIAGHTHGGQVALPLIGPLASLSEVPRKMATGETRLANGGLLIVSRGIGHERGYAPRLRFNCRPQLLILYLRPTPSPISSSLPAPSSE